MYGGGSLPKYDPTEKTKKEILKTASRMFGEKGWNNVNIEDIVKEIGVTRGAFYHYFKSREDLIYSVFLYETLEASDNVFELIEKQPRLNALEKIRFALKFSLKSQLDIALQSDMLKIMYEPIVFKSNILASTEVFAPRIEKLIEQGNKDGSTNVKYPMHTAYAVLILYNEWFNPKIFQMTSGEFADRLSFLELFGEQMGLPIIDDELKGMVTQLYERYRQN